MVHSTAAAPPPQVPPFGEAARLTRAQQAVRRTGRGDEEVAVPRYANVFEQRQAAHLERQQVAASWVAWDLQRVASRSRMEVRGGRKRAWLAYCAAAAAGCWGP
jgi:hypothetical protein